MKIIKTKTQFGLQCYSDTEVVVLFADDKEYLFYDKFKGILQTGIPAELNRDENNIYTFETIEECMDYIEENNLIKKELVEGVEEEFNE